MSRLGHLTHGRRRHNHQFTDGCDADFSTVVTTQPTLISLAPVLATFKTFSSYLTSNVTGRHRGPKRKLLMAGYRAPSLQQTWLRRHVLRCVFIVECGITCAFSAFCVYSKVGHRLHPLVYLVRCAKFRFFRGLHCWASPWRKIAYSIAHSLNHPAAY